MVLFHSAALREAKWMVSEVQKVIDAGRHDEVVVQSLFGLGMKHTSRLKTQTTGMACSQRCATKVCVLCTVAC